MLLERKMVAKPWGVQTLPPPFAEQIDQRTGEVWFDAEEHLPLMIKYIFTSEKLSIQVHPNDAQAQDRGFAHGKEECWYVIDAKDDARLGIGTKETLSNDELRAAALDGSLEELMDWKAVSSGDFFYIPAGTVHAIGAGVSLIECQQNIDLTYRLFDYGRPRELHLDDGVAVSLAEPFDMRLHRQVAERGTLELVDGPFFCLFRVDGTVEEKLFEDMTDPFFIVPLGDDCVIGGQSVAAGQCILLDEPQKIIGQDIGLALLAGLPR